MENTIKQPIDFTQSISRKGYHSEKYELRNTLFGTNNVLPMWVADMDLPTPPFILQTLQNRLQHPILGYTTHYDALYQAIIDWQAANHYRVSKSHIVFTHNVANGFYMAVQAFSNPGDAVLVQPPVYPPFLSAPLDNQRQTIEAPLTLINDRYEIDFEVFEQTIIDHQIKLFLFCHPQNPSGRVWLEEELQRIVDICYQHQVIIISDEIHSDLVYPPLQHRPLASISEQARQITVTLNSPGKTFNLGGLQIGYAIIANPQLKAHYLKVCQQNHIDGLNLFAQQALVAAYSEQGRHWRNQLLVHFQNNINQLEAFFQRELPQVKVMKPQASYLVWLDFRALFASHEALTRWLIEQAQLGLNDGRSFGGQSQAGEGFMRINLAVSTETLQQALRQLKSAISTLPEH